MTAHSSETLRHACDTLAERDPVLATAYRAVGLPNWRGTTASYESLARIVVYQLISTKAADAIWARVHARFAQMTARAVLDDDAEQLRACGLSRPKLQHLLAIATAVEAGDLDFDHNLEYALSHFHSVQILDPNANQRTHSFLLE